MAQGAKRMEQRTPMKFASLLIDMNFTPVSSAGATPVPSAGATGLAGLAGLAG